MWGPHSQAVPYWFKKLFSPFNWHISCHSLSALWHLVFLTKIIFFICNSELPIIGDNAIRVPFKTIYSGLYPYFCIDFWCIILTLSHKKSQNLPQVYLQGTCDLYICQRYFLLAFYLRYGSLFQQTVCKAKLFLKIYLHLKKKVCYQWVSIIMRHFYHGLIMLEPRNSDHWAESLAATFY